MLYVIKLVKYVFGICSYVSLTAELPFHQKETVELPAELDRANDARAYTLKIKNKK